MNQVEAHMSNTIERSKVEWKDVNWRKAEKAVFKLQKRIYQASTHGNLKVVRKLQKTLMRSWSARLLAVRKVTQDNQGKVTSGIDGIKNLKPQLRLELAKTLRLTGTASPTRRVNIPKPGKKETRPLGIPTINDRAAQALAKLALEPEWEARFHENSYGFRPGRSAHDAIGAIFNNIRYKHKHVLDADISQCFDKIDHIKLLAKVNTFPTMRRQIKSWLKAGVFDNGNYQNTESGTPQGGVISPLLANIALHGLESIGQDWEIREYKIDHKFVNELIKKKGDRVLVKNTQKSTDWLGKELFNRNKTQKLKPPTIIRYADDFVILHEQSNMIPLFQKQVEEWLKDIGLELKPSKTRVTDTSEGFNFLGFNVRQYKVGAYRAAKVSGGAGKTPINLGFTTLIKPSKEAVSRHLKKIEQVIDRNRVTSQNDLIKQLNPIIKGWCNYYDSVVSSETFSRCDYQVYLKLKSWAKRRCPKTNAHDLAKKYWHTVGNRHWVFSTTDGIELVNHSATKIERHTKIQGARSPFDGDSIYWGLRLSTSTELTGSIQKLLKIQKGKCAHCKVSFKHGDLMEKDHIEPRSCGGRNVYSNLQLLHRHCHDVKTRNDGSQRLRNQKKCP